MKKRTCTFLLALLAALTLTVPAWAETQPGDALIYDTESLLTDGERQQLESLADQITWQYDCAVYVVTIYDYEQYADGVYEAAYTIYNDYDFGIGDGRDGVLLLLSMYDRSYSLYVRDGYAQSMLGSYAQQQLEGSFLEYLGDDDWYGGFHAYLTTCADMMQQASEGHAVRKPLGKVIFPALLVGCGVALAVCLVLKGKMKSVRRGAEADVYVTAEGLDLTERSDIYTHTTETRRKKEKNDSHSESGGGGSGRSGHF
jgi:uncharacterized membrane protein YgcG